MNRMLFFLSFALWSAFVDQARIEPFDVRSASRRFLAEVRVVEPDPRMARTDPRVELAVYEVRDDGERRRQWRGLYPARESLAAHFLTDDGSAFVCVDDRVKAQGPLVIVVQKGLSLASFDAHTLAIAVDPAAAVPPSWLEIDPRTCRVRTIAHGLDRTQVCDLLGRDGTLRTIDLSNGQLSLFPAESDSPGVSVEPSVAEEDARGAEEIYLDSWNAPALLLAGEPLEVHLRGYYPTPGWKLLGFELRPNAQEPNAWMLRPLATHGSGPAAQVTRPFQASGRVLGLSEGTHRLSVRGRGGPPVLETRRVEVLPRGLGVRLVERDERLQPLREIVLHVDGRVRTHTAEGVRYVLASEDARAATLALAEDLDERDAGQRPSDPSSHLFELCWIRDGRPRRSVHAAAELAGPAGDLVARMLALVETSAAVAAPARYELDRSASHFFVRTKSSGLFSVFGHDHKLEITRFTLELTVDRQALERTELSLWIDAGSLAVVGDESEEDRRAIEREMHDQVLSAARHPKIEFEAKRVTAEAAGEDVYAVRITGDLTLHGKTRSITVPARVEFQGETLAARGEFSIRQTDYDMKPVSAAGGTVKVADEVKLSFDVRARRR